MSWLSSSMKPYPMKRPQCSLKPSMKFSANAMVSRQSLMHLLVHLMYWYLVSQHHDSCACSEAEFILLAFYFNFKDSILGELVIDERSALKNIRHIHFIATPLLPCGKADSKVKKFTGHSEVGPATDDITKAIHAFAHFSLVYSSGYLVFCDLQGNVSACLRFVVSLGSASFNPILGTTDSTRTMCLIDPQIHT